MKEEAIHKGIKLKCNKAVIKDDIHDDIQDDI